MKTKSRHDSNRAAILKTGISALALLGLASAASAQDAAPANDVVVVTGFRASLQTAMSAKKKENDIVDVIKSEDIAQFPDLNLAESLQRIPGVAIDRDGGEGRTITVRGLGPDFTRVRLNGLEAQATTGGKDSSGGANRGRGFDFNVFAADLFNSITVRKSLSAEIEEGSLGATVDLQTARPFDYKGFTMAGSAQGSYNDLSKKSGGRGSFLISNRWADGKLGALFSVAYGQNTIQEEGPNTTRWENNFSPSTVGRFASWSADGGTTFVSNCLAATATGACSATTGGSAANLATSLKLNNSLHPRIPRYSRMVTDQKRLGITGSFQMRPTPDTTVTLDTAYAEFSANRDEYDLEAISFSRAGAGLPASSIYNYTIDSEGTITKASFNKVDIRAEHRFDELKTTFKQINLLFEQNFTDKLSGKLLIGASDSLQATPEQTTFTWDSYDVNGYSYDFTNSREPVFNYGTSPTGCNISQACYWSFSPNVTANATTQPGSGNGTSTTTTGDASLIRIRPQSVDNKFQTVKADLKYELNDSLTFKIGASRKTYDFTSTEYGRYTFVAAGTPTGLTRDEAANNLWSTGVNTLLNGNLASYSTSITINGNTFLVPDLDKIRATTGYDCRCTNTYGTFTVNNQNSSSRANNRSAGEVDTSSYVQADFKHDVFGMPVRGNLGVRYVKTNQTATGMIGKGTTNVTTTIERSYTDTLPAFNVSISPLENVFVRLAASKTMSRPTLQSLSPGGSITTSTQTIGSQSAPLGNPYLDPIRANTFDFSVEWYQDKDSLFSVGLFKKDLKSYIQTLGRYVKFSDTGYDASLLSGTSPAQTGDTLYQVFQAVNTPGGELKGYEINAQKAFTFLPGVLSHLGGVVNYTHVESKIKYITGSTINTTTGVTTYTYTTANLVNLSPESWNATLYWENDVFSARVSAAHREGYISIVGPGSGADFQGKNPTTNIDFQSTYKLNKHFTFVLEGLNLTDQYDDRNDQYNTAQGNTGQNLLLDYSHPGRQFFVGVRYKY